MSGAARKLNRQGKPSRKQEAKGNQRAYAALYAETRTKEILAQTAMGVMTQLVKLEFGRSIPEGLYNHVMSKVALAIRDAANAKAEAAPDLEALVAQEFEAFKAMPEGVAP